MDSLRLHFLGPRVACQPLWAGMSDGPPQDTQMFARIARGSVADAFGTAPLTRNGAEIVAQVRAERDEWGDR